MPAKVTLYSLKCEPVFDFGTGPRNECRFNPQGNNILCKLECFTVLNQFEILFIMYIN